MSFETGPKSPAGSITIQKYIIRKWGCEEFECILDPTRENPKNFNVWRGFQAQKTDKKPESLKIILNFIKEVICSNEEKTYKKVLSWIAGLVTNLKSINKCALVLQSEPGCGKNTLTEFLSFVLGQHCIYETQGIASIAQKFNAVIQGKRLIVVNELSSTKTEFH